MKMSFFFSHSPCPPSPSPSDSRFGIQIKFENNLHTTRNWCWHYYFTHSFLLVQFEFFTISALGGKLVCWLHIPKIQKKNRAVNYWNLDLDLAIWVKLFCVGIFLRWKRFCWHWNLIEASGWAGVMNNALSGIENH